MTNVTFLGLGTMGAGMAGRLAGADDVRLTVWNRRRERAAALGAAGARVAESPAEAARDADVIISMVADDTASRDVWTGRGGALTSARRGTVAIESSTLSPAWIDELAALARERGCELLDAPVTGSRTHAATGQVLFLVGGSADTLERVRPILARMGRDARHIGPIGSGARLKLINNFLCGAQAAALAEAMALIERTGLDRDIAFQVLAAGAPGSPLVGTVGQRMTNADYAVQFSLALMHKDLTYAIDEGARAGVALTTAANARDRFQDAIDAGLSERDFSAVVEPIRRRGGARRGGLE